MATNGVTEDKLPVHASSAPNPREIQQPVNPPHNPLPKPSKKTEESLVASVARFQAERERKLAKGTSAATNGTNGHTSDDKMPKVETPYQQ